jgi:NAD(P)-dependent dehydrogenase (short-subunit alcohol dehydrogenase family)
VAANYASSGVTCNAILPGFTQTEYAPQSAAPGKSAPPGSMLLPEEVASAAIGLLKDSNMNGVLLPVDRGWSPMGSAF